MRPDSSQGPDDRHGACGEWDCQQQGGKGRLETKKGEMVWGRKAQGKQWVQGEALEGQHTGQTPMCCYAIPLPTLPWKTQQGNWGLRAKLFPGHR